ncbi:unnamed protein product [Larinioides sclopetarius]|uniref:Secreted protein n=1 Tax=Larinioides sclopetarius TaxID=280406 RepID=A0AAV2B574_9ARAC
MVWINADFILKSFFFASLTPQSSKWCSVTSELYSELLRQQVISALQKRMQTTLFVQQLLTLCAKSKNYFLLTLSRIV